MIKPDFAKYSLALIKDDEIIFSSDKSGLRPLIECVDGHKSKIKDCILHDKVIGLAAAKIIIYSGMISKIISRVSSKSAIELLKKNNIKITPQIIVDNILNSDKLNICPMESKAMAFKDNGLFFSEMARSVN